MIIYDCFYRDMVKKLFFDAIFSKGLAVILYFHPHP